MAGSDQFDVIINDDQQILDRQTLRTQESTLYFDNLSPGRTYKFTVTKNSGHSDKTESYEIRCKTRKAEDDGTSRGEGIRSQNNSTDRSTYIIIFLLLVVIFFLVIKYVTNLRTNGQEHIEQQPNVPAQPINPLEIIKVSSLSVPRRRHQDRNNENQ